MQPLYSGQEAPMGGAAQCGSVYYGVILATSQIY